MNNKLHGLSGWKLNPELENATHVFANELFQKSTPRLSILLATVVSRAPLFAKLEAEIRKQCEGKPVEILIACDNKEISIGKKRQNLLEKATGDYICFIDDDDWIAPDYVDKILAALESSPDCVGFLFDCSTNGNHYGKAKVSLKYKIWADRVDGYKHVRSPHHKVPVKREIALKSGFPDLRYAEDKAYSDGILKYLNSEVFIDETLYFYRYSNNEKFNAKYGITNPNHKGINLTHVRRPFFH